MEFPLTDARLDLCDPISCSLYPAIYSEILDAHIMVGDFISVCLPEGEHVIGRLIDVSLLENVPVAEVGSGLSDNYFLDNGMEKKVCGLIHIWKKVDTNAPGYERLSQADSYALSGVGEVVESWSAMWFGSLSLDNIVFIFQASMIISGNFSLLNGMENLFFARYNQKHGANYTPIDPFESFKSTHGYSYRVFSSVQHIRNEIDKIFYRVGMSQGDRGYIHTYLPHDCWKFLHSFFAKDLHINTMQVTRRVCTKRSSYDLTQQKVRITTVLDIAEVSTQESLTSLSCLLGKSIGIGVRKKFPKLGAETLSMGIGDNVNLLAPRPTNKNKIKFRYDKGMSKLNISVWYSHFTVRNTEQFHSELIGLPQGDLIRPNTNLQQPQDQLEANIVDSLLVVDNRRYRVHSVRNGQARVIAEDGSQSSLHLPEDDANKLVDELNL